MKWDAKWIWDDGEEHPRNYWLCFRKPFNIEKSYEKVVINITADSRYNLYVNGKIIGNGPSRYWPFEMTYDTYEIQDYLLQGSNVISVLVNHYGVSTSQYIEGRAGLVCQVDFYVGDKIEDTIKSDRTWKNHVHSNYVKKDIRISFSQSWIEIFDARKFDNGWNQIGYDDDKWFESKELGEHGDEPWGLLKKREIPFLTDEPIYPVCVTSEKIVKPVGQHISLNFRESFYPDNYDCYDKIQLGYLFSVIKSVKESTGKIKLITRKYPFVDEKIKINNLEYTFRPTENEIEVKFKVGDNLFFFDMSGCYQKFSIDLLFKFDCELEFTAPGHSKEYMFLSVGPFEYKPVLNIVAADNVNVNWNNSHYKAFWEIKHIDDLQLFENWIKPIENNYIETDNVFIMSSEKNEIRKLSPNNNANNMAIPNKSCCRVTPDCSGDVEYVIDFGKELSGYIEFDIDCDKGVIFDFNFFEYNSFNNIEFCVGMNNTLRYVANKGRQTYRSPIRRGGRYVMLTIRNQTDEVKIYSVRMNQSNFPVAKVGNFRCSDYQLNKIWEISRHTVNLCLEDMFVDCPAYEQAYWVGDARHTALINYYTSGEALIHKHSLEFAAKSLERSELTEAVVPTGSSIILTTWSMLWVISCREYFEFTGDLEFIKSIYAYLKKTVDSMLKYINDKGLFEICAWNMLDWAPMDNPSDGIITHQNLMLAKVLADVDYLSEAMGNWDISFKENAGKLKSAINQHLWDESKQAFIDCIYPDGTRSKVISIQTNTLAYLYDCAEENRREIISKYIENIPSSFVQIGSPFMSFFYLEALAKGKKTDIILDYIREKWGRMLEHGATTCWETFEGFFEGKLTRSHCHAWSAAPAYFLGAYVLGVRPATPGFAKVIVEPCVCDLTWAEGSVPTPKGRIDLRWKISDKCLNIIVYVPKDVELELIVPEGYKDNYKADIQKY